MFNLIQVDFTLVKFLTLQYNVIIRATNRNESIDKEYEMEKHENQAPLVHDGISPIIVTETEETAQFNQLWSYLVPSCGRAKTAQGELIRIAGRVQHEFLDNGGINWDDDFRKMLDAFLQYHQLGNLFCCCAAMAPAKESVSRPPFISSSIALKDSFFHIIICIYLPSAIGMV